MFEQNIIFDFQNIWAEYLHTHYSPEKLLKELQEKFPFDKREFRKRTWSIHEAVLIYCGIDAQMIIKGIQGYPLENLFEVIDVENIRTLIENHEFQKIHPTWNSVSVKDFIPFLTEKAIPIPLHLAAIIKEAQATGTNSTTDRMPSDDLYKKTKQTLRKEIAQRTAVLHWKKETEELSNKNSKTKHYTNPTDLSRKSCMKELVQLINKIGNIDSITERTESGVDPEWIGHLYPGGTKPGPKPKKKITS